MRVLVVDDEVKLARLVTRGLGEHGHVAHAVGSGEEALARLRHEAYDVVVLDLGLPGVSGLEVCRRLRRDGCWTPVLVLTARDAVADRIAGLDAGADDYLVKPFAFAELLARLRAVVRRDPAPRPTRLTAGPLTLDPASREVWHGEVPVTLTAREFALLETLLRSPGRVFSRRQLLEAVWGSPVDTTSNVVDVYVRYLREKVDRPFGSALIETRRGVGYCLRAEGSGR